MNAREVQMKLCCSNCGKTVDIADGEWIPWTFRVVHRDFTPISDTFATTQRFLCRACAELAKKGDLNGFWGWTHKKEDSSIDQA